MDEVIREDMVQAVKYGENKKGKKIRKYKNTKFKGKSAYNHNFALYNLGVMVDVSIYKIKKLKKCKTLMYSPNPTK